MVFEFTEFPHIVGDLTKSFPFFCSTRSSAQATHWYWKPKPSISYTGWLILHQPSFVISHLSLSPHIDGYSNKKINKTLFFRLVPCNLPSLFSPFQRKKREKMCFEKPWSLGEHYSVYEWAGRMEDLWSDYWSYFWTTTECISFHWVHQDLSIYITFDICKSHSVSQFVCSNGLKTKTKKTTKHVVKAECSVLSRV